jgi:hypothetical protein
LNISNKREAIERNGGVACVSGAIAIIRSLMNGSLHRSAKKAPVCAPEIERV